MQFNLLLRCIFAPPVALAHRSGPTTPSPEAGGRHYGVVRIGKFGRNGPIGEKVIFSWFAPGGAKILVVFLPRS